MTSQMAADLAEPISCVPTLEGLLLSSETHVRSRTMVNGQSPVDPLSDSSYYLANDQSMLSGNVDQWIHGYTSDNIESIGVQRSRVPVVQRSTLITTSSLEANGVWYLLALILPLFSYNNNWQWRCTPSTVLQTAELLFTQVSRCCGQIRTYIRRLAHDQIAREVFATAMDIVLVVYALGFLVLSLYQATIIQ